MKKYQRVPLSRLLKYFGYWREILESREIGQIFTLPYADGVYRAFQFRDWMSESHGLEVAIIDLDALMVDDEEAMLEALKLITGPILVIARRQLLNPEGKRMLAVLERMLLERSVGILVIHEGFPSELMTPGTHISSTLLEHVVSFPLHSEETVVGFIETIAKEWRLSITQEMAHEIYRYCGGFLWLVKDLLRSMHHDPSSVWREQILGDTFVWKTAQIWESLPVAHKRVLLGEVGGSESLVARRELNEFGLFFSAEGVLPGYLEQLVREYREKALIVEHARVVFDGRDLSSHFSRSERRMLAALLEHKGEVIGRDSLAQTYWGEKWQESYSDWALDKAVSRLRKRLVVLNLPCTVMTVRGGGYECQ